MADINESTKLLFDEIEKAFPDNEDKKDSESNNKDKESEGKENEEEDDEKEELEKAVVKLQKEFGSKDEKEYDDDDMSRYLKSKHFDKAMSKKAIGMFKTGKIKKSINDALDGNMEMIEVTEDIIELKKSIADTNSKLDGILDMLKTHTNSLNAQNLGVARIIKGMESTPIKKGMVAAPIQKSFVNPENGENNENPKSETATPTEIRKAFKQMAFKGEGYNLEVTDATRAEYFQRYVSGDNSAVLPYKNELEKAIGKPIVF